MTRIFKVAFCVMTLFAAATFVGCGNEEKPADSGAETATTESTESGEGSDAK